MGYKEGRIITGHEGYTSQYKKWLTSGGGGVD